MKPDISVIMSVHNEERFLGASIESILNETYKNFEFIIVDDKSTDNSLEIIKKYQKKDKRIRIIKNEENIGLTKSLNRALKLAKGEFIARQDASDISKKERLAEQINFLKENSDYSVVGTDLYFIN